ncbi:XRE family transcriptional regulator [Actinokineospora sp. HUAS TT18]|uniref:XRE family transcriptional regulator n=1 Tax=Actinokineospora sp. HUAS TT18 TaxID=3447451 RepID=UPI003F52282E
MRKHTRERLPEPDHLTRRWKAWELGENKPSKHYAPMIAATLDTVTTSLFPPEARSSEVLAATGMDTLEIVSRLQASDVDEATLRAVRITVEKLCGEYAYGNPADLLTEGRSWLRRIVEMQEQRLSFVQRRDSLELAGWLALLVGCVEYDVGDRRAAEATRKAALSLGQEVGHPGVQGWAHEMRAWFALTSGDYRGAIAAAQAGQAASSTHSVAVQLHAQEAKAWARLGDQAAMRAALDRGRELLEALPYPDNIENHFVVDPAKYDFYAMDCYRHVGDDRLARALAEDVIRDGSDFDGRERSPMRISEARFTLGVAAAQEGDLDEALDQGRRAISAGRTSLPSLAMSSRELVRALSERYADVPATREYVAQVRAITAQG